MQKYTLFFFLIFCVMLWFYYKDVVTNNQAFLISTDGINEMDNTASSYLVWSSKCRIPNLDAFNFEAKKYYHPEKYVSCRKNELLTYLTKTDNTTTLHIDQDIVPSYAKEGVYCCYSNVTRGGTSKSPDEGIKLSKCSKNFYDNVTIVEQQIMVKCYSSKTKKEIYKNTHATVIITDTIQNKIDNIDNITKTLSVLLIGIDSISRLNLIRALPNTHAYLEKNGWIELKGYNKMGDNTFPNLMAILTGMNLSEANKQCNPRKVGFLDKCDLLWYKFRENDYVTSYAEDEAAINTFNYNKKGFINQPTDYYFRPYIIASETLKIVRVDDMKYCTGPETSGERILNVAKDFAITFKDYPKFGFFWMNSFSHNKLNSPSRMDYKIRQFLNDLSNSGVLDNTMVIFLSDHGLRFGKIRYTTTGWIEERLPFIYFYLPKWFHQTYPKKVENLRMNSNKLTTPYDIYMTLQNVLEISQPNYTIVPSSACSTCRSLFEPVDSERSCEDAGIEQHWCTCTGYGQIYQNHPIVSDAVKFILDEVDKIIQSKINVTKKCAKFSINNIISSSISDNSGNWYKNDTYLLIVLETIPQAVFEATVSYTLHNNKTIFNLLGGISRLDWYKDHSWCAKKDSYLQKYCYCKR